MADIRPYAERVWEWTDGHGCGCSARDAGGRKSDPANHSNHGER